MAAAVAQRDLAYFTFDNKKQAEDLQRMYELLKNSNMTVGEWHMSLSLVFHTVVKKHSPFISVNIIINVCPSTGKLYNLLKDYCKHYRHHHHNPRNVFDYIREKISVHPSLL